MRSRRSSGRAMCSPRLPTRPPISPKCATCSTDARWPWCVPARRPRSRKLLALASRSRTPVVPQGGNTGLVGGQVPDASGDAIILSLTRLDKVREVDPLSNTMTVEAGIDASQGPGSSRRRRSALSAFARLGRLLHHRRQSFDQCRRRRGARLWQCARSRARPRGRARRWARDERPLQAAQGQHRLRPEEPVHRRRGHARHHHGGGAQAVPATHLAGDGVLRPRLREGWARSPVANEGWRGIGAHHLRAHSSLRHRSGAQARAGDARSARFRARLVCASRIVGAWRARRSNPAPKS